MYRARLTGSAVYTGAMRIYTVPLWDGVDLISRERRNSKGGNITWRYYVMNELLLLTKCCTFRVPGMRSNERAVAVVVRSLAVHQPHMHRG